MAMIGDPATLKALSHRVRWQILRFLDDHGPATSTSLARELGENTGTTSYHLRQLGRFGLIEECSAGGPRRERWWQRVAGRADGVDFAARDVGTDEAHETGADVPSSGSGDGEEWMQGVRATRYLTVEELCELRAAYERLLENYGHAHHEDAAATARAVTVGFFAHPST